MIVNQFKPAKTLHLLTIEDVVNYLNSLNHNFYLTGSRFFGNYTESSDYDFFVVHSVELKNKLSMIGFNSLHESGLHSVITDVYDSNDISDVMRKVLQDGTQVDIQLLQSDRVVSAKNNIQNCIIKNDKNLMYTTKDTRRRIWNLMFEIYLSHDGLGSNVRTGKEIENVYITLPSLIIHEQVYVNPNVL